MSKKISIILICIIVVISLIISIYIPNRDKIEGADENSIIYSVIESNGKKGIAENGQTIIEPQYENIIIPNEHRDVFMCQNVGKDKFINKNNEEIFNDFSNVKLIKISDGQYEKNILTYQVSEKYGLLGINGKTITDAKYDEIFSLDYKEGEVVVKEKGKYGVIDEKGNIKIKCEYNSIQADEYYTEENGYKKSGYIVQIITNEGYRYGYCDYEGSKVLQEEYNQISRLVEIKSNDIYLIASKNGQYGVFVNNNKIINTQYQSIEYNSTLEVFVVERTGKFGVINIKGAEILKPEYTELQINGIYIYTIKDEEKKVWNANGKEVNINFDVVIQKTNSEYFIKSESGHYSILNSKMEQITNGNYKYLEFVYNNYFIAINDQDRTGIIDLKENIIVDFKYDVIQQIKENNAIQAIDFSTGNMAIFNQELSLSAEIVNANVQKLKNGFKVYNDEKELIFDKNGNIIETKSLKS